MYSYRNTLIEPLFVSNIRSRFGDEISVETDINGLKLKLPIIASPMDVLSSPVFHKIMAERAGTTIHRFWPISYEVDLFQRIENKNVIVSVGIDDFERAAKLIEIGAKYFLVDVANGFNTNLEPIVKFLKNTGCWVMAGSVASGPGFEYLDSLGVDAVRTGIGTGSRCKSRTMTSCGFPILSGILSCAEMKERIGSKVAIIADGGATEPGDLVRALFCGADAIMVGYIFSKCLESADGLRIGSYRSYRGMASYSAQADNSKEPKIIEGAEEPVKIEYTLDDLLKKFEGGLRSGMSYLGAHNIQEMRGRGNLVCLPDSIMLNEGYQENKKT